MFSRRRKTRRQDTPEPAPASDGAVADPGPAVPRPEAATPEIPDDDAELMRTLRTRLFDRMTDDTRGTRYAYSRRIGPLIEVLCRDLPTRVETLTDEQLAGRDLELLFAAGRRNTEVASSDLSTVAVEDSGPMWLLEGDHFFVSSQLGSMPSRIAERAGVPAVGEGVLVVAPRRGSLVAAPLIDETSLKSVGMLFDFLERFGDDTGFEGLYFVFDPEVAPNTEGSGFSDGPLIQNVRGPSGPGDKPSVVVDGPFEEAMMRAGLIQQGGPPDGDAGAGPGER
ncbi:hypothetical protein [uncultured Corynebacterium sp.]|uniref:hypothetical protein n=1 Tax=uncultured Corynebacterium sp. TaxID=159447 RepID=UPI0025DBBD6C|nr:hypothetical protein [uncultured Corynebacterium sp.]